MEKILNIINFKPRPSFEEEIKNMIFTMNTKLYGGIGIPYEIISWFIPSIKRRMEA